MASLSSAGLLAAGLVALVAVAACGKGYDTGGDGVNDVAKACNIRVAWNTAKDQCTPCMAAAKTPRCECPEFKDYSAACHDQESARRAEPSCTDAIEACTVDCKNDCNCVERCYANAPACRRAASARDGCIVEVCDKYCKP